MLANYTPGLSIAPGVIGWCFYYIMGQLLVQNLSKNCLEDTVPRFGRTSRLQEDNEYPKEDNLRGFSLQKRLCLRVVLDDIIQILLRQHEERRVALSTDRCRSTVVSSDGQQAEGSRRL